MKTGILTFPNSSSYGAVLQMYALYHTVKNICGDVEIINYYNSFMKSEQHYLKLHASSSMRRKMQYILRHSIHYRQYKGFHKFEQTMELYPASFFEDTKRLQEISNRYDNIICGSDQVWNPDITNSDMSYFLDFCDSRVKRISYAPSFGVVDLAENFSEAIKKELSKFSYLSVREEQGQTIIWNLIGQQIPVVVDPTLLLTEKDWKQIELPYQSIQEDYIFYYTIKSSDSLFRFCLNLAEQKNMKILVISGNVLKRAFNRDKRIVYACDLDPREWLYLIRHAKYVVTNSFHGTAFAINFRKNFYVEFSSLTNSRLEYIIRRLGLQKRIVADEPRFEEKIDYTQVNKILSEMREESLMYLNRALQK